MNARPRPYNLGLRAERQEETRRRILRAASDLHETLGPARTSLSAVAKLAGVQRHTLYRYFPDETSLLQACGGQYVATHPLPDASAWMAVGPGGPRIRRALGDIYGFFEANQAMLGNIMRDSEVKPVGARLRVALPKLVDPMLAGWQLPKAARRDVRATLHLAANFYTWRTLTVGVGLSSRAAAEFMARLATAIGRPE